MSSLQQLYEQILFLFSSLSWFGMLDLLLVTAAFYFLIHSIRRSSAGYLLREILFFGITLFILTAILPLPVFDWLVRGVLVALLVATPIIFQAQLRQFIERTGRQVGMAQAVRQGEAQVVLSELIHAVDNMAGSKTGALIALEGKDSLDDVIQTGISFGGRITAELLQSIFYSGTPLHDGAVILRTDEIEAAGCVLPLTQQSLTQTDKRLGTRHRAAVGLSEMTDALIIVVSEETGQISVAYKGELNRGLSSHQLSEMLTDFYEPTPHDSGFSLWRTLLGQLKEQFSLNSFSLHPRHWLSDIGLLFISFVLALVVWSFVIEQTNAIQRTRIEDIPLRVENVPADVRLIPPPPNTVSAVVQTTEELLPSLSADSFQAVASFTETEPRLYRLQVRVNVSVDQALISSVDPPFIDVEIVPIISRTMPIQVDLLDVESLSAVYEMFGTPLILPSEVQITGPAPDVEQVVIVHASLSVANASPPFRESRPLRAVDEQGREISSVTLQPNRAQISVNLRRRSNARNVSVRPVIIGPPPVGYWLSNLSVRPAGVTLQGEPSQLTEIGSFVDTLPVDVSQAAGDLSVQTPLNLPSGVRVLDADGNSLDSVIVLAQVTPRVGDITEQRTVELIHPTDILTVEIVPEVVDLLLSGPLPTLREIEANPDLVSVTIDWAVLQGNGSEDIVPHVVTPPDITAQLVPPSVLVTISEREE